MTELEALLILNAVPGLGNRRIRQWIERFGSANQIFSRKKDVLVKEGVLSERSVEKIFNFDRDKFLKSEYNLILKHDVSVVKYDDEEYPENLKTIPDAPIVLYYKGKLKKDINLAISMVGSRNASCYGLGMAEKFAVRFAELGITVVSGLARGIDAAAHRGCLKAGGLTIAVLGCGLAQMYPPENQSLLETIIQKGIVFSEFPVMMPALPYNFPRRNRIVSGLSLGVLVVEASLQSGALITSQFALEQGREVFALPGQVDQRNAHGCHRLIQEGAKLANCVEDILEELRLPINVILEKNGSGDPQEMDQPIIKDFKDLSETEQSVYRQIQDDPVFIDEIAKGSNVAAASLGSVLLNMEFKKIIRQLPGKYYVRVG